MSEAAKTLKISVEMGVSGQGEVKAANEELDKAGQIAGTSSRELGTLGDTTRELSGNTENLGGKTKEASHATEEHVEHSRIQHKILSEINRLVPGLGEGLHLAFAGPLGAVAAATVAIGEAKSALDEFNKKLDETAQRDLQPLADSIQHVADAWDNAAASLGKYLADLAQAGSPDTTSNVVKGQKETDDTRREGLKKYLKAIGAPESQIEALDNAAPVETLQTEQEQRATAQHGLEKTAHDAEAPAARADAKVEDVKKELENLREANAPGAAAGASKSGLYTQGDLDALNKLKGEMDEINRGHLTGPNPLTGEKGNVVDVDFSGLNYQQLQNKIATTEAGLGDQKKREEQLKSQETSAAQQKEVADKNLTDARQHAVENQARLNQLPDEISQAKTIQRDKNFNNYAETAGRQISSETKLGDNIHDVSSHNAAVQALHQGAALSQQLAQAAKAAAQAHSSSLGVITQAIQDLQRANEILQSQIGAGRGTVGGQG